MSNKTSKTLYVIQIVKSDHSIIGYCGKKASQFLAIPCSVTDDQFITDHLYAIKHLKQYKSRIAAERFVSKRSLTLKDSYHLNVIELPHAVIDAIEKGFATAPK